MGHHTKDKGDLGVAIVVADLARQGIQVALPLSEHQPFDLLAFDADHRIARVQVKFRTTCNYSVHVRLANTASNARGFYNKPVNLQELDAYAVYVSDHDRVYYVSVSEIPPGATMLPLKVGGGRWRKLRDATRIFRGMVGRGRIELP